MKLKIEYRKPGDLIPYGNNARLHSPAQIEEIANSIKTYGFNNPILIDPDNGIIAGHGRNEAALILELAEVPVVVLGHLSEKERRAYIIADNKIALNSTWDLDMLSQEIGELVSVEFDVSNMGFTDGEIEDLLKTDTVFKEPVKPNKPKKEKETPEEAEGLARSKSTLVHTCPHCNKQFS